jgi:hypothetical protein
MCSHPSWMGSFLPLDLDLWGFTSFEGNSSWLPHGDFDALRLPVRTLSDGESGANAAKEGGNRGVLC